MTSIPITGAYFGFVKENNQIYGLRATTAELVIDSSGNVVNPDRGFGGDENLFNKQFKVFFHKRSRIVGDDRHKKIQVGYFHRTFNYNKFYFKDDKLFGEKWFSEPAVQLLIAGLLFLLKI